MYVHIAAGGIDYEPDTAFSVEIPSGEISVPFSIMIFDDNNLFDEPEFEGNESFSLTIDSSLLPDRVTSHCMLVTTIVDDDGELDVCSHVICTYVIRTCDGASKNNYVSANYTKLFFANIFSSEYSISCL